MTMSGLGELRKVLIIYTGGTIGMKRNRNGVYAPVPDLFLNKIKSCHELNDAELAKIYSTRDHELITKAASCNKAIAYQVREYQPLLDSSNMSTKEWILIAKSIEENYYEFDGFVILSGTSTLAYTSSVLSFMFKNLQKPIVVTGSQVPIFEPPSDAISNILSALSFAGCYEIPEVCVYFANKLMRGNRVKKIHTSHLDAFDSPNYHLLAETGLHTRVFRNRIYPKTERGMLSVFTNLCEKVGILYIFPTLTRTQLLSFLEPTLEGVVLMAFGIGNIPSHRRDLMEVLRNAVGRGVTVVLVTQCIKGPVSVSYETGRCMEEIGIISCHDMTVEAAYAKLVVVCGMVSESEERAEVGNNGSKQSLTNTPPMGDQVKEVLVLYTGGTIGMQKNKSGVLAPVSNTFTKTVKQIPELYDQEIAENLNVKENQLVMTTPSDTTVIYEIKEYVPLLDSSNVATHEWIKVAEDIKSNYCNFDGFVVLHGTDTLAFTSSILSFMLENLSKPVIITGSQVPIFERCTDAIQNLLLSLTFASSYSIPEVAIYFYNKLIRGNRARKINALEYDAFDSPNYHPLAEVELGRKIRNKQINFYNYCVLKLTYPGINLKVHTNLNGNIGIIYFYPTISSAQIKASLQPPIMGAVIQTFGSGDIPSNNKNIIGALKNAIDRGVVIINVTQCNKGSVTSAYETTQALNQMGVISGNDMTVEAAYAKLVVLLGMPKTSDRNNFLSRNMRGEMSE